MTRLYPSRPILAASVAVVRAGRVLLASRVAAPGAGLFALPGGAVEAGETMAAAALRELREETGVCATIVAFNAHNEVIETDLQGVRHHYVIASFVAEWQAGEATPGPEAAEVRWILRADIGSLPLVAGLGPILHTAFDISERGRCG